MSASSTRPFAPDFDFSTAEIYRELDDPDGQWNLCRNWNEFPAREREVEQLYLAWLSLAGVTSELAHHLAKGHLVIADGLAPLDELGAARFLEAVGNLVLPSAVDSSEEVPDAGAG